MLFFANNSFSCQIKLSSFYSASGTAGIETNSQFPVESDSTDAETNDESGNSTELHDPPESEAPQKIEGKMCVYDYLYDLHRDSSAYPMCSAIQQYSYLISIYICNIRPAPG